MAMRKPIRLPGFLKVKKLHIIAIILLAVGLFSVFVPKVSAVPPLPSGFYGTVKLDGANVPVDTQVTAWCGSVQYATSPYYLYEGVTVYALSMPGDDLSSPEVEGCAAQAVISFHVGDYIADQTAIWMSGTNAELNLTASTDNPVPTATHTPTSTLTPTNTHTLTSTPTHTASSTPTHTSTFTPTPTSTPTLTSTPLGQHSQVFFPVIFH